ncbi:hypothetical protein LFM56_14325 [Cellulomonas iranensis]|uniref:hypothetical protein n=1 Tax=Cellulomonas iranensis TaxID=76862 RepID=UPI001CF5520C|nr:hypothetical protein [Cellulomonas iranensis]UCN14052.1 hypothetical protein LFM56_14325 [Cellulomonas iranensis]
MVALTVERQALVMLSFAVTHNAVADWHHRRRQHIQALAPAARGHPEPNDDDTSPLEELSAHPESRHR